MDCDEISPSFEVITFIVCFSHMTLNQILHHIPSLVLQSFLTLGCVYTDFKCTVSSWTVYYNSFIYPNIQHTALHTVSTQVLGGWRWGEKDYRREKSCNDRTENHLIMCLSDSKIRLELLVDKFSSGKQTNKKNNNKTSEPNHLWSKAVSNTSISSK